VRDRLFRNRPVSQTLEFFDKVQLGEKKYIAPHKCYAEFNIDTFIAYEAAAYKEFISKDYETLKGTKYEDIITILEDLKDVDLEQIPDKSLVREFIGGSRFEY